MAYIEVKMNTSVTKWERQLLLRMTAFLLKWKKRVAVILGPSGAGKSTVLNILGGMDSCDEGKLLLMAQISLSFQRNN